MPDEHIEAGQRSAVVDGVSEDRMLERIHLLAAIGGVPNGGMHRLPFSGEDAEARRLVGSWLDDLGLESRTDAAGNLLARWHGRESAAAPVMTGSHLDTQPFGGRFDGIAGVVGSLDVLEAMKAAGHVPKRSIEFVVWAGEEGSGRFDLGMIGSRAMVGQLSGPNLEVLCHFTGRTLRSIMEDAGIDVQNVAEAEWLPGSVSSVVELHIEQGPYLEEAGIAIGVVGQIAGNWRLPLVIQGRQSHSGATPMSRRKDALCAAAEIILAAEKAAGDADPPVVATSGYSSHEPRVIAIVPGRAEMTLDVRSPDADAMGAVKDQILDEAQRICERRGVELEVRPVWGVPPTPTDEGIAAVIEDSAAHLGYEFQRMPSWAGHDSMMLGKRFPAGMVFVPSIGGVSHAPEELSLPEDLLRGTRVLCQTVLALAERPA